MQSLPEPGHLVEVRKRRWVVTDVEASADLRANFYSAKEHLVTLSSIGEGDDSFDERLSVIWELEPGVAILESAGLPLIEGWDDSSKISAFLDAVRWGTTSSDRMLLQAPFRSGIEIHTHQLEPLVRAVEMTRINLLIADDVGLGKTIEAGLVVQEMLTRHRARSVLIVCPASLQLKWKHEMWEKFGLKFNIVNTEYLKKLRRERGLQVNPWTSFPRLITSMDWMKSNEGLRLIKDAIPPSVTYPREFDILIVDEAHNIAPSGSTRYAIPSKRTQLIRLIAPHFQHKLFLTATPHNGYQESFTALLELLDDQRFARSVMPTAEQLRKVMVRRLKSDLVDEKGDPFYASREIEILSVDYSDEEVNAHRLLKEYTRLRSESEHRHAGMEFIHKLLKKRLFSSPMAFFKTLQKHRQTVAKGRSKKPTVLDERILHKAISKCEEDYSDDRSLETAQEDAIDIATKMSTGISADEKTLLDELHRWAENSKNRPDSKAKAVLNWLDTYLKTDGQPNEKRVIFFTEYRATHLWLTEILKTHGWAGDLFSALHGGTDYDEREQIKAAFQADPSVSPVRILLATDAASEGIDLQNHCNYLIHLEIPWNPNVMEQRNGRIDRHGQRASKVHIWHPLSTNRSAGKEGSVHHDDEFLFRAVKKIQNMREDLGSVGPVISRHIEEMMLGKSTKNQSFEESNAVVKAANAKKFVTSEKKLKERIKRLHERLLQAKKEQRLEPENIRQAVEVALRIAGKGALIPIDNVEKYGGPVYHLPLLTGSWAQSLEGLTHPHTGVKRPITFDHKVAQGRDDVVLAHLQHKLVQMSLRLLRAEVWAPEDTKQLHRVAFRSIPDSISKVPLVVVWSRLLIVGGGSHRLHEELTMAMGELKNGRFSRITSVTESERLRDKSSGAEPNERSFQYVKGLFELHRDKVLALVNARSKDRLKTLINTMDLRRKAEEKDLTEILRDLETLIRNELEKKKNKPDQLELFSEDERDAVKKDHASLQARLNRIPEEREAEIELIRKRYADPQTHTFPVAIEFLVPESILGGAS